MTSDARHVDEMARLGCTCPVMETYEGKHREGCPTNEKCDACFGTGRVQIGIASFEPCTCRVGETTEKIRKAALKVVNWVDTNTELDHDAKRILYAKLHALYRP